MNSHQAAFECGQLAERMAQGYYAYKAAIEVARDSRARVLVPAVQPGQAVPVGYVIRKDRTRHVFDYQYYLDHARTNPAMANDLERVWLAGALLAVGDAASAHGYFDRAPELELLRHMRNGIAHGNRFRIDNSARLSNFPAHNRFAWVRSDTKAEFEITSTLQGQPVLFDFMGPGDVLDILMSIGLYLMRMGNGDPLRP